jgi:hypothetical protein
MDPCLASRHHALGSAAKHFHRRSHGISKVRRTTELKWHSERLHGLQGWETPYKPGRYTRNCAGLKAFEPLPGYFSLCLPVILHRHSTSRFHSTFALHSCSTSSHVGLARESNVATKMIKEDQGHTLHRIPEYVLMRQLATTPDELI